MFSRVQLASLFAAVVLLWALGGCAAQDLAQEDDGVPLPSELNDESYRYPDEHYQTLERMKARRPEIRALLEAELIGEGDDGLLAMPPSSVRATAAEWSLAEADNADRASVYASFARGTQIKDLQAQVPGITEQVVSQVCADLGQAICASVDLEARLLVALNAAIEGKPLPSADDVDSIIRAIVEPIVDTTLDVGVALQTEFNARLFAAQYRKTAPSGAWVEVDGSWRQAP